MSGCLLQWKTNSFQQDKCKLRHMGRGSKAGEGGGSTLPTLGQTTLVVSQCKKSSSRKIESQNAQVLYNFATPCPNTVPTLLMVFQMCTCH